MERVVILVVLSLTAILGLQRMGAAMDEAVSRKLLLTRPTTETPAVSSTQTAGLLSTFTKTRRLGRALSKTHPHIPRNVRAPLSKWLLTTDVANRNLVLRGATLSETLSAWFFADGLPFSDRGLPFTDAEFAAAQKAWRQSKDIDAASIDIRATHENSLRTGRRTVAYVNDRLGELSSSSNELVALQHITRETLTTFDAALSANRLSKSDILALADRYMHAVDLRPARFDPELRSSAFVDREMPFFSASNRRWTYRQLYDWFRSEVMPRELPHPYKRYEGARIDVARYKALDDQHLAAAEARGAFPSSAPRAKRQELWFYIENAADVRKQEKARIVHALRKWKGQSEAARILEAGLERDLQLRPGLLLIDELEGWMAQGW